MFFTDIETERLLLKNAGQEDAGFFLKEFSNASVNRFLFDAEPCADEADAIEWIRFYTQPEPRSAHRWILIRKSDGEKIGTCGFHCWDRDENKCEIGWDLYPDFLRQGYMTEAVAAILNFAREKMFLISVDAHIADGNVPSEKLAQRLGFADTGTAFDVTFHGKPYLHRTWRCDLRRGIVRPERFSDHSDIARIHDLAFGHDWESRMISRMRNDAVFCPDLSLVAEKEGAVIGHVMFSRVTIESPVSSVPAAILAPLAVQKEYRSCGTGTALVTEGIRRCKEKGYQIVLVYGGPYYERFGFELAHTKGIFRPNPMPGEVVRVLALKSGVLDGVMGVIRYPAAFRPLIEEWY